jgi:Protoglobin
MNTPAGYTYGSPDLTTSPVALTDLNLLKATLLWSEDDTAALRRAGAALAPQVEAILDVWYGFVGGTPHLVAYFAGADGEPDGRYLGAVRERFAKWIVDVCAQSYDQAWLDYQNEVALRHHAAKKNQTDHVVSTSPEISMRYLIAFIVPLTVTIRPFLAPHAENGADLDAMYNAWFKAVTLTATLWSQPYSRSW